MNETFDDQSQKCENTCISCLTTTNYLNPMSFTLRKEYKKIIEMEKEEPGKMKEVMKICNICCWQFRRFLKFKQQCQKARMLLTDEVEMKLTLCHNFEKTKTEVYYFPDETQEGIKLLNGNSGDYSNVQENGPLVNSLEGTSPDNLQDDEMNDTEYNDYDEVPLVLLKEYGRSKKRKKRKNVGCINDEKQLKPAIGQDVSSKRIKKELKEGFTSRMVQETNEYVVIKLTKEQVLQEMEDRSKSEAYVQSPFKCEKCVKGFNFQDVLRTHMERHTMEIGSFQCDMCSQYCHSAVSLRGHVKSHTTRYKCKLCGVVRLSRQHLLEHYAITHTRQPVTYSCDTCHFNTNKRTVMQRHVKSHASTEPHACHQCGKLFKSIDSLRVHTMRHDQTARLQCSKCDVTFVYQSLLRRHMTQVHERRDYYCVECDAQFKSNESLRLHFKKAKKHRDSSSYKYECSQCTVSCVTSSALEAHSARAHGGPRAHACAACPRLYSSRDALRAHVWRTHSDKASCNVTG